MNRIILIGNGFDLAHGLKTSYRDFIDWFWQNKIKKINNRPKVEVLVNQIEFRDDDIQILLKDDIMWTPLSKINDNLTYIELTKLLAKNYTIFFENKFLEHISNKILLQNWVDIENEYYNQLLEVRNEKSNYSIQNLNSWFEQIKHELEKYLTSVLKNATEKNVDLENLTYSNFYFKDFTQKGIDNLTDIAYQKILSLKEKDEKENLSIHDASETTLNVYHIIKAIISREKPIIHNSLIDSLDTRADFVKLLEKHKERIDISSLLLPENVLFLNFNYTNTVNKYSVDSYFTNKEEGYKREFRINQKTIHIHGELNNDENPIIFGYGDELADEYYQIEKLNNNDYLKNIKSINYLKTDNYKSLLNFIDSGSYQIFIWGHSCSNSDRTLLNTLFEHENCVSIKPFYYKKEDGTDSYEEISMNISRNFKDKMAFRAKVVNRAYCEPLPQIKKRNE